MRLKVLGCHGGESPSHRMTCFQIDDHLVIDAGALSRGLSTLEQRQIDHIYVSHIHLDHVRDIATLADNVIGTRKKPVEVYCVKEVHDAIMKHFFNNQVWPDFSKIPNPQNPDTPVVRFNPFDANETVTIAGKYSLSTVAVTHPVPCYGAFLNDGKGTLVYSGDTGPTDELWKKVNACDDLKAFILEVSFPDSMEKIAQVSGHLTPKTLVQELKKYKPKTDAPVYLYGMKPNFSEQLKEDIAALGDSRLTMLKLMDEIEV